jgi:hypothetical protein
MSIQDPGYRPTEWGVAGDHESRIRKMEANPGGSAASARPFGFGWFGPYPLNIIQGATFVVPEVEGASMTFNLTRILFRLNTPGTTSTTMHVEKSSGGGAFSGSTVGGVTLTAGSYEGEDTTSLGSVTSGDLLRLVWDTVGTNARDYTVEVEGTEA